jgi:hypothetical protein
MGPGNIKHRQPGGEKIDAGNLEEISNAVIIEIEIIIVIL